jgi:PHD/YefM family antitoxin component YafN of YafNO toxin-antitoxin module
MNQPLTQEVVKHRVIINHYKPKGAIMKTQTFEQLNSEIYELRASIERNSALLAEKLALFAQFADIVQIETRICKENVKVVPANLIEWENI